MASPLAQWGIDEFYGALVKIEQGAIQVKADLDADKTKLSKLWDSTFYRTSGQVGPPVFSDTQARQDVLRALIHQNSVLRVMLNDINAKYKKAVNASADFLKSHGYNAPTLAGPGLGFVVAFAPLAAVTIIVTVLGVLGTLVVLTAAQRKRTDALAALWGNPSISTADKLALMKGAADDEKAAGNANPFKFDDLIPILGLVLAIVAAPTLLKLIPQRSKTA